MTPTSPPGKVDDEDRTASVTDSATACDDIEVEDGCDDTELDAGDEDEAFDGGDSDAMFDWRDDTADVQNDDVNPHLPNPLVSFLPPAVEVQAVEVLNNTQAAAVRHVVTTSKEQSEAGLQNLLGRVKALGYTEDQLRRTLHYIRDEAPIIIHAMVDQLLPCLLKDTHYRNQFETHTSHGSLDRNARTEWENRMFNRIYHNAKAFDRVKYGVLNIVRDPFGVQACNSYGDSYFVLQKVRLRCSFASKDTSCMDVKLASCEHYAHVLAEYTNEELRDVMNVAIGKFDFVDSRNIGVYKEIQVHGPVELKAHVAALVVNQRHTGITSIKQQLDKFKEMTGIPIVWMTGDRQQTMNAVKTYFTPPPAKPPKQAT